MLCVVGDGEAETGPLAASWHSNKFLDPARDGAVLPILHLNGYKIANPTVLARIPHDELAALMEGYGYRPIFVEGDEPEAVHQRMAAALDEALDEIAEIQRRAREDGRPRAAALADDRAAHAEGLDRAAGRGHRRASHQVPLAEPARERRRRSRSSRSGCGPTGPRSCSTTTARRAPTCSRRRLRATRRMGAEPARQRRAAAAGPAAARLPRVRGRGADAGAARRSEATRVLGALPARRDRSATPSTFRLFGPDETASNRLSAPCSRSPTVPGRPRCADADDHLAPDGRVMEVLSEHLCQGWLEGYLLTGRHGLFNCYEAFIHIIDSMFNQHAKWLKVTRGIPWRRPIASLNYLLTSHVWRQDHNGFSHQDPGFIDHVVNKKAEVVRVYLPPDANCLLSVADHCLRSRDYVNVIVAGKQPALDYLPMDEAIVALHARARHLGLGEQRRRRASPTSCWPARATSRRWRRWPPPRCCASTCPTCKVRVVNVVDLMRLQPEAEHPHGLPDAEFDALFTTDRPVIFAYHGYPWLIHRLTYRRTNHHELHVRGYKEEGTTTTPFDMVMLNDIDRFHLVMDVIDRVPGPRRRAPRPCASTWSTSGSATAPTRASTATTAADVRDWTWPGVSACGSWSSTPARAA